MTLTTGDLVTAEGVRGIWRITGVRETWASLSRSDAVARDSALFVSRLTKVGA